MVVLGNFFGGLRPERNAASKLTTQAFSVWHAIIEKNQRHPRENGDPERLEGPANVPIGFPAFRE